MADGMLDLNNLNLSEADMKALAAQMEALGLNDLNLPNYGDITAALTGGSPVPSNLADYLNVYNSQVNLLSSVGTLENVDIDDRPYWYNYPVSGVLGGNKLDPTMLDQFKAEAGIPESFSMYDTGGGLTQDSINRALQLLSSSDDPMKALSEYYGIDLTRAENPDAIYTNAGKYGSDAEKMAEFQSIIEPVLQKIIPYLQVTQGLRYDEALEYAYKNDPMISTLYNQYGVDLFRQTSDGSTYFFDPISGTESRTVEVKDSSFRDVGLAIAGAAFTAGMGSYLSGALANSSLGATLGTAGSNMLGSALSSAFVTGMTTGFDKDAMLDAMLKAGISQGAIELLKTDTVRELLNNLGEGLGVPTEFQDTNILEVGGQVIEEGTDITEVMGLGDTLATLLGEQGKWQLDASANLKPFFFDKTIEGLINLIPKSTLDTLFPFIEGNAERLKFIADLLTGQGAGGGFGGEGGSGGFGLPTVVDTDGDGTPDDEDEDDDNDGIPDEEDTDDNNNGVDDDEEQDPSIFEDTTASDIDTDGDGIMDTEDDDDDNDGVPDADDAYPKDPSRSTTDETDMNEGEDGTTGTTGTTGNEDLNNNEEDGNVVTIGNTNNSGGDDLNQNNNDEDTVITLGTTTVDGMLSGGGSGNGDGELAKIAPFTGGIGFNSELLSPYFPKQSKDYLAELLARLQR